MLVAVGLAPEDPGQQPVEGAVMIAAGLLDWYHPVFHRKGGKPDRVHRTVHT